LPFLDTFISKMYRRTDCFRSMHCVIVYMSHTVHSQNFSIFSPGILNFNEIAIERSFSQFSSISQVFLW